MTDNIQQYLESTISRCLEDTMTAVTSVPQEALENMETAAAVMSLSLPDNKIICLGSSLCQPLCSIFTQVLNSNHMYTTQKINAVTLNNDAVQMNHLYPNLGIEESLKVQFDSVVKMNDCLMIISDNANESQNFLSVIQYAHECQIPIIAINHLHDNVMKDLLNEDDIQIVLHTQNTANFTEVVLVILNVFNVFLRDIGNQDNTVTY